ncbi:uncharacterized protein LOC119344391, partial [Triticum dicoccoides]|uniref:uncharacterized protein LOC119344391 n=1 Tax=Triticum dicoccoides TaxID=85692 RepID=UPI00188FF0D8
MRATPAASATEMSTMRLVFIGWLVPPALPPEPVVVGGGVEEDADGGAARQGTWSGKPQSPGLLRKAVAPWLARDPDCGISPERLLKRRSRVTVAGRRPSSGGTASERRLREMFSVPASAWSLP